MLKNIIKNLKPSSTLKINEISRELEVKGEKIFKFGFGQSPFQVPLDIVNELKNNAHQNKYMPVQGLKELREVVAKYNLDDYGISLIKDNKKVVVNTLKLNSEAKKSGFKTGDFISEFKIENLDRPNKGIVYPLAILLLIIFGYFNYRRKD